MNRTSVDFYAFRCKESPQAIQQALAGIFTGSPAPVTMRPKKGGWKGYERSYEARIGDMPVGLVAEGGENQRGWAYIGITGQGCDWIEDWDRAQEIATATDGYQVKRVDIAYDTFDTSKGFDNTLAAYREGGFNTGGRPPKCEPMKPERSEDSAIIRIGNRERDKYYRGYEKGKEQLGPQIAAAAKKDGDYFEADIWAGKCMAVSENGEMVLRSIFDWFRHEVELKPKSGPLPEDVIDRRDQYFAGCYPYLGTILEDVDAEAFIVRRNLGPQLSLTLALEALRRQWGNTLFTALHAHNGDMGKVWDLIVGHKHSDALLQQGVLLTQHE